MRLTVSRKNLAERKLGPHSPVADLDQGQILLRVERCALTANNITYGYSGELPPLYYYHHFPSNVDGEAVLPAAGFATVIASANEGVPVGSRYYGFYPMATLVVMKPGNIGPFGFKDVSTHRKELHDVYLKYSRVDHDPFYCSPRFESYDLILRGLFFTGWLLNDYLVSNQFFGAAAVVITSASSKTSLGLAYELSQREGLQAVPVMGITSERNVGFCRSVGLYDSILTYKQLESGHVQRKKIVYVDMAGVQSVLERLSQSFDVAQGVTVGMSHSKLLKIGRLRPKPSFFFAGMWIDHLKQAGRDYIKEVSGSYRNFITNFIANHIEIVTANNSASILQQYDRVLNGQVPPSQAICLAIGGSSIKASL